MVLAYREALGLRTGSGLYGTRRRHSKGIEEEAIQGCPESRACQAVHHLKTLDIKYERQIWGRCVTSTSVVGLCARRALDK
jgi:hypothetical protein